MYYRFLYIIIYTIYIHMFGSLLFDVGGMLDWESWTFNQLCCLFTHLSSFLRPFSPWAYSNICKHVKRGLGCEVSVSIRKLAAWTCLGEQIWVGVGVKHSQPRVPRALQMRYSHGTCAAIRNILAMSPMMRRAGFLGPTREPNRGSFSKRSQ